MDAKELRQRIVALGDRCVTKGEYGLALEAYRTAWPDCPSAKIEHCGDFLRADGKVARAILAYQAIGAVEKLVACGLWCLRHREFELAQEAYRLAGVPLPVKELHDQGRLELSRDRYRTAAIAFRMIQDQRRLLLCGGKSLRAGQARQALEIFRWAGVPIREERLLFCAETAEAKYWENQALAAYRALLTPGQATSDLDYSC